MARRWKKNISEEKKSIIRAKRAEKKRLQRQSDIEKKLFPSFKVKGRKLSAETYFDKMYEKNKEFFDILFPKNSKESIEKEDIKTAFIKQYEADKKKTENIGKTAKEVLDISANTFRNRQIYEWEKTQSKDEKFDIPFKITLKDFLKRESLTREERKSKTGFDVYKSFRDWTREKGRYTSFNQLDIENVSTMSISEDLSITIKKYHNVGIVYINYNHSDEGYIFTQSNVQDLMTALGSDYSPDVKQQIFEALGW